MAAKVMAAVPIAVELDQSLPQKNKAIKLNHSMASVKTLKVDPLSLTERSCKEVVRTSEIEVRPSVDCEEHDWPSNGVPEPQILDEKVDSPDSPAFNIRDYVFAIRTNDFSKCWPFSQRILDICLHNGRELQLPPFDPPRYSQRDLRQQSTLENFKCRNIESKDTNIKVVNPSIEAHNDANNNCEVLEIHKCFAKASDVDHLPEEPGQKEDSNRESEDFVEKEELDEKKRQEEREEDQECFRKKCNREESETAVEKSDEKQEEEVVNGLELEMGNQNLITIGRDEQVSDSILNTQMRAVESCVEFYGERKRKKMEGEVFLGQAEVINLDSRHTDQGDGKGYELVDRGDLETATGLRVSYISSEDRLARIQKSNMIECLESKNDHPQVRPGSESCTRQIFTEMEDQIKNRSLLHTHVMPNVENQKFDEVNIDECSEYLAGLKSEGKNVIEFSKEKTSTMHRSVASMLSTNNDLPEIENKMEAGISGDENVIAGIISDALVTQVCPVCRSFTSPSNTALNAHIDRCLAVVSPAERIQKLQRHRMKPKKKRLMADICAAAAPRTLEDLELSSQKWALMDVTATENVPCSLSWRGIEIRRQPRTPLYRGPAGTLKGSDSIEQKRKRQRFSMDSEHDHKQGKHFVSEEEKVFKQKIKKRHQDLSTIFNSHKSERSFANVSSKAQVEVQKSFADSDNSLQTLKVPESLNSLSTSWVSTKGKGFARPTESMLKTTSLRQDSQQEESLHVNSAMARNQENHRAASGLLNGLSCSMKSRKSVTQQSMPLQIDRGIKTFCPSKGTADDTVALAPCTIPQPDNDAVLTKLESMAAKKRKQNISSNLCMDRGSVFPQQHAQTNAATELPLSKKKQKRKKNMKEDSCLNLVSSKSPSEGAVDASLHDMYFALNNCMGSIDWQGTSSVITSAGEANKLSLEAGTKINRPTGRCYQGQGSGSVGRVEAFQITQEKDAMKMHADVACNTEGAAIREHCNEANLRGSRSKLKSGKMHREKHEENCRDLEKVTNMKKGSFGVEKRFERTKNNKGTPKTKKIVNIAIDCINNNSGGQAAHTDFKSQTRDLKDGWPTQSEDLQPTLEAASNNPFKSCEVGNMKKKRQLALKGGMICGISPRDKHPKLTSAEQRLPRVDMDHILQQTTSLEGSLVISNEALVGNGLLNRVAVDSDSTGSAYHAEEVAQASYAKVNEGVNSAENSRVSNVSMSDRHIVQKSLSQRSNQERSNVKHEEVEKGELVTRGKVADRQINRSQSGKEGHIQVAHIVQASDTVAGVSNCISTTETLRMTSAPVSHGGTCCICVTETFKERVHSNLKHKQTVRSNLAASVTSIPAVSVNQYTTHSTGLCALDCFAAEMKEISHFKSNSIKHSEIFGACQPILEESAREASSVMNGDPDVSLTVASRVREADGEVSAAPSQGLDNSDVSAASSAERVDNSEVLMADASDLNAEKSGPASTESLSIPNKPDLFEADPLIRSNKPNLSTSTGVLRADDLDVSAISSNQVGTTRNLSKTIQATISISDSTLPVTVQNMKEQRDDEFTRHLQKVKEAAPNTLYANALAIAGQNPQKAWPSTAYGCSSVLQEATPGERSKSIIESAKFDQVAAKVKCRVGSPAVSAITLSNDCIETNKASMGDCMAGITPTHSSNIMKDRQMQLKNASFSLLQDNERRNQPPLQVRMNGCNEASGNSSHPQILPSWLQVTSGSSSIAKSDRVSVMPSNPIESEWLHASSSQPAGSLFSRADVFQRPSNQPVNGLFSDTVVHGERDHSASLGISSRSASFENAHYHGEPGVVHIFGNPVFKLMGKNVMVSNRDGKPLGEAKKGILDDKKESHFLPNFLRRLECTKASTDMEMAQDCHARLSQSSFETPGFSNQGLFPRGRQEEGASCQENGLKSKAHAFLRSGPEVHTRKAQNSAPSRAPLTFAGIHNFGGLGSLDSVVHSGISNSLAATERRTTELKRQLVAPPTEQPNAEIMVIDNLFLNGENCMPSFLHKGGCTTTQLDGRSWSLNPRLQPLNGQQMHYQAPASTGRQSNIGSKGFLGDLCKLELTETGSFDCNSQRTGTLFDIVQSSERKDRMRSSASGSLLP